MPLPSSEKPSKSGAFKSFWFKLLDLPEDDQFQRLIHSQLISAPSPSTSASQGQLRHQFAGGHSASVPPQFAFDRFSKTADHPTATKSGTGEQVQFASSNQNSVYCVSSVSLGRLAYEEQQSAAGRAGSSAGAPLGSVQSAGLMQQQAPPQGLPTPTQLTIATELPTATKFTTRAASFVEKPRPMHSMHKKGEHRFIHLKFIAYSNRNSWRDKLICS